MPFREKGFLGQEAKDVVENIRKQYSRHFSLVDEVVGFTNSIIAMVRVEPASLQDCLAAVLLAKSFQSVIILAQNGLESDCKTVLRGMLDTVFIFASVCKDEDFAFEYIKSEKATQLKLARAALSNRKDLNFDQNMIEALEKQIDMLEKESVPIRSNTFVPKSLRRRPVCMQSIRQPIGRSAMTCIRCPNLWSVSSALTRIATLRRSNSDRELM